MTTKRKHYRSGNRWKKELEAKVGSWEPGMDCKHFGTYTEDELLEGILCPTCMRDGRMNRYHLNAMQGVGLIALANKTAKTGEEFHHIDTLDVWRSSVSGEMKKVSGFGGQFASCSRWGLISDSVNDDPDKKTSGFWKLTPNGWEFVLKRMKIHKYCFSYENTIFGFWGEMQTIDHLLGKHWSYAELYHEMTGRYWDGERGHDTPNWGDDAQSFLF